MCFKGVPLKSESQLDTLSRSRMVEEKQEGGYFAPPPGKIGLSASSSMKTALKISVVLADSGPHVVAPLS